MSAFYDLASLVVVPSGYKSGKIYAQKPLTTDGQLTFSRASTATRVNASGLIETVASNVPRLDYLGSTCPKLQLEPSRTNSIAYSEQLNLWTAITGSVSANAATSPDGTANADKFVPDNGANALLQQLIVISAATHTFSVFAKDDGITSFGVQSRDNASAANFAVVTFDLSSGTIVSSAATGIFSAASGTITNYGNGWYRCTLTFTSSGSTTTRFRLQNDELGDGTKGLLLYGAQAELSSTYATSYIPTTTAAVTRLADYASKASISTLFGATATTFVLDFVKKANATGWTITGGNGTKLFSLCQFDNTGGNPRVVFDDGVDTSSTIAALSNGRHKIAVSYATNDTRVYIDGALVFTDTACTYYRMDRIGVNATSWTGYTNNTNAFEINQFLIIPAASTNAQLAELTAL